jgi:hypothetical protein
MKMKKVKKINHIKLLQDILKVNLTRVRNQMQSHLFEQIHTKAIKKTMNLKLQQKSQFSNLDKALNKLYLSNAMVDLNLRTMSQKEFPSKKVKVFLLETHL